MKKIILSLSILVITAIHCFAANVTTISELENNLFGFEYTNEADSKRIERIEEHLYGNTKNGNLNKRIEEIQNDIGYINKEEILKTQKEKELARQKKLEEERLAELKSIKEDKSVDYPIVDNIEKVVFNENYKDEDIYVRLDRLENKIFNKKNETLALNERVDKLAAIVLPKQIKEEPQIANKAQMTEIYNSGIPNPNNQSLPFQLAVLEQNMLNNTYNNDHIANRLARLEQELFNRTFANDSDITRLQRIMVTYEAKQNSYKYENNRKMQKMATASQFGGILLMILAMLL